MPRQLKCSADYKQQQNSMKKLIFLIVILALAAANAFAARIYPAEGRVVDEQGQAVEYATVVLLKGSGGLYCLYT